MTTEQGEFNVTHNQWSETDLIEYFSSLGAKKEHALLPINEYPEVINLSKELKRTLNLMRRISERKGVICFSIMGTDNEGQFFLPDYPLLEGEEIKSDLIKEQQNLLEGNDISILGSIQSSPQDSPFTPKDLYFFLQKINTPKKYMKTLVTPKENIMVLRTKDSKETDPFSAWPLLDKDIFEEYWLKKAGFKLVEEEGIKYLEDLHPQANKWRVSLGISDLYNLALYRGLPHKDLARLHPRTKLTRKFK